MGGSEGEKIGMNLYQAEFGVISFWVGGGPNKNCLV